MKERNSAKPGLGLALTAVLVILLGAVSVGIVYSGVNITTLSGNRVSDSELMASSAAYWLRAEPDSTEIYDRAMAETVYLYWKEYDENGEVTGTVSGSGIVLSSDGYILTNAHCVSDAQAAGESMTVEFSDGSTYESVIVGADTDTDVALLKIDAAGLQPAAIGTVKNVRPCQTVYVMGHPAQNLKFTITSGIVSGLDRSVTFSDGTTLQLFQLDAAVNPGNSGGPVYDTQGNVVGMVTAKYVDLTTEGIGFATPIDLAIEIAGQLKENGFVRGRPLMGITVSTAVEGQLREDSPAGALIYSVEPGLCGEKAGLRKNDIIIRMGNAPITSMQELVNAKKNYRAGDSVELRVWRDGQELTVVMTFDEVTPEHRTGSATIPAESEAEIELPEG